MISDGKHWQQTAATFKCYITLFFWKFDTHPPLVTLKRWTVHLRNSFFREIWHPPTPTALRIQHLNGPCGCISNDPDCGTHICSILYRNIGFPTINLLLTHTTILCLWYSGDAASSAPWFRRDSGDAVDAWIPPSSPPSASRGGLPLRRHDCSWASLVLGSSRRNPSWSATPQSKRGLIRSESWRLSSLVSGPVMLRLYSTAASSLSQRTIFGARLFPARCVLNPLLRVTHTVRMVRLCW